MVTRAMLTRADYTRMKAEAEEVLRFMSLPRDLQADTPKVLSGYWYTSETLLKTAGKFDTPIFDRLAYERELLREISGEAEPDRI